MSVVALTVPLELSDAGAIIPIPGGGGTGNGTIFVVDTAGFNSISIQFTGTWLANVQFQTSNDRVNWVNTQGFAFNSQITSTDTVVDNDVYLVPVIGRYFQVIVSNYQSGPIGITAYLRYQSIAGLGEASLTQAMDQATGTPINVGFQGFQGPGQQNAANAFPVALANESVADKLVMGRVFTNTIPVNTIVLQDYIGNSAINFLDCIQYRSIYIQIQAVAATGGAFAFEASNDTINWLAYPLYQLTAFSGTGINNAASSSGPGSGFTSYGGPLGFRYFRVRISTATTVATTVQVSATLRMTPFTSIVGATANIAQIGGSTVSNNSTMINSSALGGIAGYASNAGLYISGQDRSTVRPELTGAPIPNAAANQYLYNGPHARVAYVDLAGGVGVAGTAPWQAEDKTYPVNVRLERTTAGQDSVQDILQQVLVELKAMSYYVRELPMAISSLSQTPNPLAAGPTSMQDDPENFFDDPTLYKLQKGH